MVSIFFIGLVLTVVSFAGIYKYTKDKIEHPILSDTQLLLGFDKKDGIKWPIAVDMKNTPHLFVCGLSGSGKSRMVEYAVRGKNVILVNAFKNDFKTIKTRRIIGSKKILDFFNNLLKEMYFRKEPLYIVIDEILTLCTDSKIEKAIMELLAIGRHYNIFIIAISQTGTKETCKFKDLFNCRVCFRQVEESAYRTVLGYSPDEEDRKLRKRQFLYYSTEIGKGYTYDVCYT